MPRTHRRVRSAAELQLWPRAIRPPDIADSSVLSGPILLSFDFQIEPATIDRRIPQFTVAQAQGDSAIAPASLCWTHPSFFARPISNLGSFCQLTTKDGCRNNYANKKSASEGGFNPSICWKGRALPSAAQCRASCAVLAGFRLSKEAPSPTMTKQEAMPV